MIVTMTVVVSHSRLHGDATNIFDHHHHHQHHHDEDISSSTSNYGCGAKALSVKDERVQRLRLSSLQQQQQQHDNHPVRQRGRRRQLLPTSCQDLCRQCIQVPVKLHMLVLEQDGGGHVVVPHPTAVVTPLLLEAASPSADSLALQLSSPSDIADMFGQNVQLLNRAFADTPFYFDWNGSDDAWDVIPHNAATFAAVQYKDMLGQLRQHNTTTAAAATTSMDNKDDARTLHVYVAFSLLPVNAPTEILFGYSTFPAAQTTGDGVYLRYDVLMAGGRNQNHWDSGYWLVHEVGHWLGVLHTFQTYTVANPELYACGEQEQGLGDFVSDTPLQRGSSMRQNCLAYLGENTPLPDTCPNLPGSDALFNYMGYISDHTCWAQQGEFTCGQKERMFAHWTLFRDHASACENPQDDMEIEVVIEMDGRHGTENRLVLEADDGSEVIYDSLVDHAYTLAIVDGPILLDHCLPRTKTYTFTAYDGFGTGGRVQIYVDRTLIATIEGEVGYRQDVPIQSGTSAPTPSLVAEASTNPTFSPVPSLAAETSSPTLSSVPSVSHSSHSSEWPSFSPTEYQRSGIPSATSIPSVLPSYFPSMSPTLSVPPSLGPSVSYFPTISGAPSLQPSTLPTPFPSIQPSTVPSVNPSFQPSRFPSHSSMPSDAPSLVPTLGQTVPPSKAPSSIPTAAVPTDEPTFPPTVPPSKDPSPMPSALPTVEPTVLTNMPSIQVEQRQDKSSSVARRLSLGIFLVSFCFMSVLV